MIARMYCVPETEIKKYDLKNLKNRILKGILLLAVRNFCVSYIQLNPSKRQSGNRYTILAHPIFEHNRALMLIKLFTKVAGNALH
jgi:hypothetical protein